MCRELGFSPSSNSDVVGFGRDWFSQVAVAEKRQRVETEGGEAAANTN